MAKFLKQKKSIFFSEKFFAFSAFAKISPNPRSSRFSSRFMLINSRRSFLTEELRRWLMRETSSRIVLRVACAELVSVCFVLRRNDLLLKEIFLIELLRRRFCRCCGFGVNSLVVKRSVVFVSK